MKSTTCIASILVYLLLAGCSSNEKTQQAAKQATISIGASECSINRHTIMSTEKATNNVIELIFSGKGWKYTNKSRKASRAAFVFYKSGPSQECHYDHLRIIIKSDSADFKRDYSIRDLAEIDSLVEYPVKRFFDIYKSDTLKVLIDTTGIACKVLKELQEQIEDDDTTYGRLKMDEFEGFEQGFVDDSHEPIVIIYYTATNGKKCRTFEFQIYTNTKKILNIGIGQMGDRT